MSRSIRLNQQQFSQYSGYRTNPWSLLKPPLRAINNGRGFQSTGNVNPPLKKHHMTAKKKSTLKTNPSRWAPYLGPDKTILWIGHPKASLGVKTTDIPIFLFGAVFGRVPFCSVCRSRQYIAGRRWTRPGSRYCYVPIFFGWLVYRGGKTFR